MYEMRPALPPASLCSSPPPLTPPAPPRVRVRLWVWYVHVYMVNMSHHPSAFVVVVNDLFLSNSTPPVVLDALTAMGSSVRAPLRGVCGRSVLGFGCRLVCHSRCSARFSSPPGCDALERTGCDSGRVCRRGSMAAKGAARVRTKSVVYLISGRVYCSVACRRCGEHVVRTMRPARGIVYSPTCLIAVHCVK